MDSSDDRVRWLLRFADFAAFDGLPRRSLRAANYVLRRARRLQRTPAGNGSRGDLASHRPRLHINNGHTINLTHRGGDVVVSYAGVPIARGRTPGFGMTTKETAALPVKATSAGVGVPEDLFLLVTEERRWGMTQLRVEFDLAWTLSSATSSWMCSRHACHSALSLYDLSNFSCTSVNSFVDMISLTFDCTSAKITRLPFC
jgi:hypothetical protein